MLLHFFERHLVPLVPVPTQLDIFKESDREVRAHYYA